MRNEWQMDDELKETMTKMTNNQIDGQRQTMNVQSWMNDEKLWTIYE